MCPRSKGFNTSLIRFLRLGKPWVSLYGHILDSEESGLTLCYGVSHQGSEIRGKLEVTIRGELEVWFTSSETTEDTKDQKLTKY